MVPNGLLPNASAGVTRRLDPERWAVAEGRTAELIARIQPNAHSESRRLAVFHYVQRLIMNCLSCQVFTFGSVPLKTYLPDGDIDVTAFSNSEELKEIWANLVRDALEREEKIENAEFHVKEVQYIQAEVKIIKCLVENIAVDISFNQVGGLCTLCFLEQIDNLISQNHLFKRSIILIKAWCYYESRILGAHHGLISTYALETLVLYIFHIFNNSFTGPLEVMYRFLEFFSNFDWEKFCLSLWGPVPISSLPDMTAEPPRMDSGELLLDKSFLDKCSNAYGVVPRTQENQGRPFVSKHFNIVDPLRANNNLGRSVSKVYTLKSTLVNILSLWQCDANDGFNLLRRFNYMDWSATTVLVVLNEKFDLYLNCFGNFFRIRSAFAFGAKRLGKLLECPKEDLITELNQFFTNTWTRHGSGSRSDVQPLKVFPSVASNSHSSKRNILTPEVCSNHSTKSSWDKSVSSLNSSSHFNAKEVSDSNSVSGNYRENNGCVLNGELPSVSESSGIRHDEQGLVNSMDSVKLHGSDGQIRLPMQKSSHLSVAHSPLLAPIAFSQKHLAGVPPPNLVGAPWLPNMQFLHGFVTPTSQYMHNPTWAPNVEEGSESEEPITSDADHDTNKSWHQYGIGSGQFDLEARDPHIYDMDGKERPSLPNGVHGAPLERQMEFAVENNGADGETYTSMFQDQTSREGNVDYSKRSGFVNVLSHGSSSRGKTLDACSWDEVTENARSSRDKSGKRLGFVAPATSTHSKTGGQMRNATDHRPTEVDDGPRKGTVVPIINEASEIVAGPDYFSTQTRTSASYLIDSPQQRQADNSGLTFVPTGAPVPFVVFPFVPGNSDGSGPQFDRREGIDQLPANIAGQNFSSLSDVDQPDSGATSTPSINTMTEPCGEHKPDILNGDLVSHWHNLQYARFCQTARPLGPVLYPFPVPPMYLHGHAPWDGPGRPAAPNVNWTQMIGPGQRVFPVMPLQPATERGTGVFQHYGEDVPRYRGGTGTYFPNPKVPFRDRHSNSRNYRGGYNGDRSDYSDKEGSWINSKQRNPNRSYGRSQSERSGMRSDRQANDESQSDRQRRTYMNDSYRHEASSQYVIQGQSFGSASSIRKPGNIAHGVYTPQSTASNAAGALSGPPGPPFVMVYSYEPGANHGASTSEPIEFGSLGPLPTADGDDIPRSTRQVMPNGFYGQRRGPYRGGSSHSSPDQPSSPQPRR